ncbi:MAG: hypothetical protein ACOC1K_08350 [Nanoarchaeota archaeon]
MTIDCDILEKELKSIETIINKRKLKPTDIWNDIDDEPPLSFYLYEGTQTVLSILEHLDIKEVKVRLHCDKCFNIDLFSIVKFDENKQRWIAICPKCKYEHTM